MPVVFIGDITMPRGVYERKSKAGKSKSVKRKNPKKVTEFTPVIMRDHTIRAHVGVTTALELARLRTEVERLKEDKRVLLRLLAERN